MDAYPYLFSPRLRALTGIQPEGETSVGDLILNRAVGGRSQFRFPLGRYVDVELICQSGHIVIRLLGEDWVWPR